MSHKVVTDSSFCHFDGHKWLQEVSTG